MRTLSPDTCRTLVAVVVPWSHADGPGRGRAPVEGSVVGVSGVTQRRLWTSASRGFASGRDGERGPVQTRVVRRVLTLCTPFLFDLVLLFLLAAPARTARPWTARPGLLPAWAVLGTSEQRRSVTRLSRGHQKTPGTGKCRVPSTPGYILGPWWCRVTDTRRVAPKSRPSVPTSGGSFRVFLLLHDWLPSFPP